MNVHEELRLLMTQIEAAEQEMAQLDALVNTALVSVRRASGASAHATEATASMATAVAKAKAQTSAALKPNKPTPTVAEVDQQWGAVRWWHDLEPPLRSNSRETAEVTARGHWHFQRMMNLQQRRLLESSVLGVLAAMALSWSVFARLNTLEPPAPDPQHAGASPKTAVF